MKIEKFWNQAFVAALARLPPAKAKLDADEATRLCIAHWQNLCGEWVPEYLTLWKDQKVADVPLLMTDMIRPTSSVKKTRGARKSNQ